jgi:hypothetical protein
MIKYKHNKEKVNKNTYKYQKRTNREARQAGSLSAEINNE